MTCFTLSEGPKGFSLAKRRAFSGMDLSGGMAKPVTALVEAGLAPGAAFKDSHIPGSKAMPPVSRALFRSHWRRFISVGIQMRFISLFFQKGGAIEAITSVFMIKTTGVLFCNKVKEFPTESC